MDRVAIPQYTEAQAIALIDTRWWKGKTATDIVMVQLRQDRLCMDLRAFHGALEAVLGRPVFTHELADPDRLWEEVVERRPKASLGEILSLLPQDKTLLIPTE